jgi:hypothetical protein
MGRLAGDDPDRLLQGKAVNESDHEEYVSRCQFRPPGSVNEFLVPLLRSGRC